MITTIHASLHDFIYQFICLLIFFLKKNFTKILDSMARVR